MRIVAGVALILQGTSVLHGQPSVEVVIFLGLAVASGLLLLVGLWTPVVAVVGALIEYSAGYFWPVHDPWIRLLLGALDVSLALLGPGAYSVDARLFGWKRIDIPDREISR